jgi:hypothetical protein
MAWRHIRAAFLFERRYKMDEKRKEAYEVFKLLNPCICKEGNQWCVWYGNEWRNTQIIGFGKTINLAIIEFYNSFNKEITYEQK